MLDAYGRTTRGILVLPPVGSEIGEEEDGNAGVKLVLSFSSLGASKQGYKELSLFFLLLDLSWLCL